MPPAFSYFPFHLSQLSFYLSQISSAIFPTIRGNEKGTVKPRPQTILTDFSRLETMQYSHSEEARYNHWVIHIHRVINNRNNIRNMVSNLMRQEVLLGVWFILYASAGRGKIADETWDTCHVILIGEMTH